jgi:hypothetical protein
MLVSRLRMGRALNGVGVGVRECGGWTFLARGHMWPKIGMVGEGRVAYTVACG